MQALKQPGDPAELCPGNRLIPIRPGLFDEPDASGRIHLLGSKCEDCGQRMFPARARCVGCYGANLSEVRLERLGKVDCFTIVRQAPPGYAGPVPYVLAMVVLGNDVHVLAHLTGKAVGSWRAGESVVACAMPLLIDPEEARHALSYAFRPAKPEDIGGSK
jgi:uncharacterized OB-fold protein